MEKHQIDMFSVYQVCPVFWKFKDESEYAAPKSLHKVDYEKKYPLRDVYYRYE